MSDARDERTPTTEAPARLAAAEEAEGRPGTAVTFKLERFEGPLDLLLHLIKRDEIDIYDIPIAHITQQYLAYLDLMRSFDLEVAGEFLVMAATLMRIKARMLLPVPPAEEEELEDPREGLVQRLLEYRQFKEAAGTLQSRELERRLHFERGMVPGEDETGPLPLAPATLFDLLDALNRVLSRLPERTVYEVQGEIFTIEEKMALIQRRLAEEGTLLFGTLLEACRVRLEAIVVFMALLELVRLGEVRVLQSELFGEITLLYPQGDEAYGAP
jgi:segregation and condensation protein A